ncbi:MAG: LL-diaminopimelate aminotransferase [Planctomycetota bacterium]|nr:LL-diaminopimelate aminotransferase [Planctomycetota bacterium]MDA1105824.1 LL-diaminopimelate aminotransferase [Planctomycetota bacterium]
MARLNHHFLKLTTGYLFPEIARRVARFEQDRPEAAARIIRCGIGDVTEPLPAAALEAMHAAVDELSRRETFRGYPPATGYDFVREAIVDGDFHPRGCDIGADEIFLSDGSKPDASAILEILGCDNVIAVADPVYPVYVDTNVMAGHTGEALTGGDAGRYGGIVYLDTGADNGFIASPPTAHADIAYLCFPNNPTGAVATRAQLESWVRWARDHDALILFDAAYEAFITDPSIPHSIYEIPGAREVAIEFRSFSKIGGFTGVRAGYTVVPKGITGSAPDGGRHSLHALWSRRWATCSNGVSWPVQRGVAALYTDLGRRQTSELVRFYLENARLLSESLRAAGLRVWGGVNAPYVWASCPAGFSSWQTFDLLLGEAQVVVTPGSGFGRCGEGYFRVSAFNGRENVIEAGKRMAALTSVGSSR